MCVLIGLIDQPIRKQEKVGWDTNKVGGEPIWLTTPPVSPATGPSCCLCGGPQSLVTQLYCPLGDSAFHRCFYIFACPKRCNLQTQGWKVFRSMQYDAAYDATCTWDKGSNIGHSLTQEKGDMDVSSWTEYADDWGEGANDWGDEADDWGDAANDWGDEADHWCGSEADASHTAVKDSLIYPDDSVMASALDKISVSNSDVTSSSAKEMYHLADNISAQMNISSKSDASRVSQALEADSDCGVEEMILVADAGRLDAMAEILNIKNEEGISAPADNPSFFGHIMFKPFYLEVIEEPVEEEKMSDHVLNLIKNYEKSEGHSMRSLLHERPKSGKGKSCPCEGYEKSELRHGDRKFHKFLKRLQRCPQQCVRYNRGGDPLLVNELEDIESCPNCGGERIFELQLLPALLPWLQAEEIEDDVEIDFGTVMVFTCKKNCWQDKSALNPPQLMEEVVVLQGDPDRHLYR
ncbi:hypothetical protein RRG08_002378 [Elysia crispata]|uniref:Programmed cell death protein 2 C-terminal domain-containing protein n=1 Tax=Elysia crispata TaxID=231223 RepID=A0AAE1EBJ5_9GAST|nr:hypothetical protein RRG08_002378 [Elysia crispata]